MNGYARSEEIVVGVRSAATRCGIEHSGCGESPFFIFSAGRGSGADELAKAIAGPSALANDIFFPPGLIDSLARQLIAAGFAECGAAASTGGRASPTPRARAIDQVVESQIRFYKDICTDIARRAGSDRWGFVQYDLPADYAVYLRFLFPAARCLFLRRNPVDAYQSFLAQQSASFSHNQALAASLQTHCTELAAGFERWHSEVQGLLLDYERLAADGIGEIETFLEIKLASEARTRWVSNRRSSESLAMAIAETGSHPQTRTLFDRQAAEVYSSEVERLKRLACVEGTGTEQCAVLVPIARYIEPECEESLRALEGRGYKGL